MLWQAWSLLALEARLASEQSYCAEELEVYSYLLTLLASFTATSVHARLKLPMAARQICWVVMSLWVEAPLLHMPFLRLHSVDSDSGSCVPNLLGKFGDPSRSCDSDLRFHLLKLVAIMVMRQKYSWSKLDPSPVKNSIHLYDCGIALAQRRIVELARNYHQREKVVVSWSLKRRSEDQVHHPVSDLMRQNSY